LTGALLVEDYLQVVLAAGFEELTVGCMVDVFFGSPHVSDAKEFDTRRIVFIAIRR